MPGLPQAPQADGWTKWDWRRWLRPALAQWTTSFSSPLLPSPRFSQVPTPFKTNGVGLGGGVSNSAGLQSFWLPTLQCASWHASCFVLFCFISASSVSTPTLHGTWMRALFIAKAGNTSADYSFKFHVIFVFKTNTSEKGLLMNKLVLNCIHNTRHRFDSMNIAESAKRRTVCSVDFD